MTLSSTFLQLSIYAHDSQSTPASLQKHLSYFPNSNPPPAPKMKSTLILLLCGTWFLSMLSLFTTLLYRTIMEKITNPETADSTSRTIPMAVGIIYLGFICLTVQNCFFPAYTPGWLRIKSKGPDGAEQGWYGPVTRVQVKTS